MKIFTPYRVCPLGAHVDHQHGVVTGFAIDKGVSLEFEPTEDGSIYMTSKNFPGTIEFHVEDSPEREMNWGDFLRGAERSLAGSAYNARVDECKSAAYAIKAFSGMDYGKYADTCLRNAPGDFIAWLCGQSEVYAYLMPRMRYDIGNLESYEEICSYYKGIE